MRGSGDDGAAEAAATALAVAAHGAAPDVRQCASEGSFVPDCAKLRAETSNIVGCVVEYCHELEAAPVLSTGLLTVRPLLDEDAEADMGVMTLDANEGGEASVAGGRVGERGSDQLSGAADYTMASVSADGSGPGKQKELQRADRAVVLDDFSAGGAEAGVQVGITTSTRPGLNTDEFDGPRAREPSLTCERLNDQTSGYKKGTESSKRVERCGYHWKLLELPPVPLNTFGLDCSTLKTTGASFLHQIMENNVRDAHNWNANVLEVSLHGGVRPELLERLYFGEVNQELQVQKSSCTVSESRRVSYNMCDIAKSCQDFLYDESTKLLKTITRTNTRAILSVKDIIVPNVFEKDWEVILNTYGLIKEGGGSVNYLSLPFALIREDNESATNAVSKLVSIAEKHFRRLQGSDVSLTRASTRIPSVWSLSGVVNKLAILTTEELKRDSSQSVVSVTSSSSSIASNSAKITRQSPNKDMLLSNTRTKESSGGVSEVNNTSTFQVSGNLMVTAEDTTMSTDYFLSDKFLRCSWSGSPDRSTTTVNDVGASTGLDGLQRPFMSDELLQKIARPALWDLMRKKLIQAGGASIKNVLDCIALETLEALIYQQYRTVKKMSQNPSAFSSEDIVEACTSLRQAVWLHTLRLAGPLPLSVCTTNTNLVAFTLDV
ncbi:unnamed protein product [Phytophthora fragariaefolia]|uniref:Unnamed protein product n=1 Tax=Phytophthora fragariaefolia TaxID=1490495 RepID=A0A9W6Y8H6_9STRA|nr:unnamed protein product [Phytophthora fragariaefolia]